MNKNTSRNQPDSSSSTYRCSPTSDTSHDDENPLLDMKKCAKAGDNPDIDENPFADNAFNLDSSFVQADATRIDWPDFSTDYNDILVGPQQLPEASGDDQNNGPSAPRDQLGTLAMLSCDETTSPWLKTLNNPFSQIGPSAYATTAQTGPVLLGGPERRVHKTNSILSDHVISVEYFLRQRWMSSRTSLNGGVDPYIDLVG